MLDKPRLGDTNDLDERNTKTSGYLGTSNNDQSEESVTREDADTSDCDKLERLEKRIFLFILYMLEPSKSQGSEAAIGAASDPFIKGLQSPKILYEAKPWEEPRSSSHDMVQADAINLSSMDEAASNHVLEVPSFPWKEELNAWFRAMNFFAGLLLLLMTEENTILDDASFDGNRVILFRIRLLLLMELYGTGPALVTTKDARCSDIVAVSCLNIDQFLYFLRQNQLKIGWQTDKRE
ncbi:hypothetical protein HPP92_025069 [Vanilla planifolia]|uniref:Uncharacterized protein n=1 Tax=Vanilla planifolia TaxID=51239 RepID=A0A835PEP9_VANPL|nr:hypothetical protein HPP92_025069 [Vanilla planifolia]